MTSEKRMLYLDALKGVLIVLVVLGHVIQSAITDYQHDILFRLIYSFHMPLFFLISGYLTYKGKYDERLVSKRFVQCIIPFVTWAFLLPILENASFDLARTVNTLLYPDNGLWFLYNLFFYCVMVNLSERWASAKFKQEYVLLLLVAFSYVLMAILHTTLNATQICWYFPFLAMGYYMRKYPNMWHDRRLTICIMGGYILTVPFWMMREEPLFYRWVNLGTVFSYCYRYFVEFAGAYTFFVFGRMFLNIKIPVINYIGKKTLGIYAFQFLVLYHIAIEGNSYINILLTTVLCTLLSLASVEVVHRIKYVRLFIIGEK